MGQIDLVSRASLEPIGVGRASRVLNRALEFVGSRPETPSDLGMTSEKVRYTLLEVRTHTD